MNGSYYQNPTFPNNDLTEVKNEEIVNNEFELSEKAIYQILNNNKGKKVKIYASFPNAIDWKNKLFEGVIEYGEKDYLIISNPKNGEWNIIPFTNIDYINFEEKIKKE